MQKERKSFFFNLHNYCFNHCWLQYHATQHTPPPHKVLPRKTILAVFFETLELPPDYRMHPTINKTYLRKFIFDEYDRDVPQEPEIIKGELHYHVDYIVAEATRDLGREAKIVGQSTNSQQCGKVTTFHRPRGNQRRIWLMPKVQFKSFEKDSKNSLLTGQDLMGWGSVLCCMVLYPTMVKAIVIEI